MVKNQAPAGTRCIFCGCDVSGSYISRAVYRPAPELGQNRIKIVGYGWSCDQCQYQKQFGYYKPWYELDIVLFNGAHHVNFAKE